MWDDPRQLNATAATLAVMALAALLYAAFAWLVRQPVFAFREVVVTTPLARANGAYLEAVVRSELSGTFFTLDLNRAREAIARVPWVRGAGLRRQWPRRLEIEIEEHAPLARWSAGGLVNTRGDRRLSRYTVATKSPWCTIGAHKIERMPPSTTCASWAKRGSSPASSSTSGRLLRATYCNTDSGNPVLASSSRDRPVSTLGPDHLRATTRARSAS